MTDREAIRILLVLLHEAYDMFESKQALLVDAAKQEHPLISRIRSIATVRDVGGTALGHQQPCYARFPARSHRLRRVRSPL
jgi:hypothetical protein